MYIKTDHKSSAPVGFLFDFAFQIIELINLQQFIIAISLSRGVLYSFILFISINKYY